MGSAAHRRPPVSNVTFTEPLIHLKAPLIGKADWQAKMAAMFEFGRTLRPRDRPWSKRKLAGLYAII